MKKEINQLLKIKQNLLTVKTVEEKLVFLKQEPSFKEFFGKYPKFQHLFSKKNLNEQFVLASVIAIGQGHTVFKQMDQVDHLEPLLNGLIEVLLEIEGAYRDMGGIIGYHHAILSLIDSRNRHEKVLQDTTYKHPPGYDITLDNAETRKLVRSGISNMKKMVEIYPVGGSGDRFDLHDESTGEALPVAILNFCGHSLLKGLVRDLQAREYLHYKLTGNQIMTPIAMMVSKDKDNADHVKKICEENQWFGRSPESFQFFLQPLVPMVSIKGNWVMKAPLQILLKPGGHGVIWQQALREGVLDWLIKRGHTKALIRQINNPIAGIDHGLSALFGCGCYYKKAFGFASCSRLLNASEGMDVLIEKKEASGVDYKISNIEYTEFEKHGLHDVPASQDSPYSLFPANTNILFADLQVIKKVVPLYPIPGMLINTKHTVKEWDEKGNLVEVQAGRLESTMQNIADVLIDHYPQAKNPIKTDDLKTFVTYNDRKKTIAVSKKAYKSGEPLLETPEGCLYELLKNHHELLTEHCQFQLPELNAEKDYLKHGPSFLVVLHPALGPLYSVIGQKIRKGKLAKNSELVLEIAELSSNELSLDGSLLVFSNCVFGEKDSKGIYQYSETSGKCVLNHVTVKNLGIDRNAANKYWKHDVVRKEACKINLEGNAEFHAQHVTLTGDLSFDVPHGYRMTVTERNGKIHTKLEEISAPTWSWKYQFDKDDRIVLSEVPLKTYH